MAKKTEDYTIFEDQDDYIEDIQEQISKGIERYVLYAKMFGYSRDWHKHKLTIKQFLNYEIERAFSRLVIKETEDGTIIMKFKKP